MGFQVEQTIVVSLDFRLAAINKHLTQMMLQVQREINSSGYQNISGTDFASVASIMELRDQLFKNNTLKQRLYVIGRTSKFLKLYRLRRAALTECYETLLSYCTMLREQAADKDSDQQILAQQIIADTGFKLVEEMGIKAITNRLPHPKVSALVAHCGSMHLAKNRGLIFVGNKLLGQTLAKKLNDYGLPAATLMGAHAQNQRQHAQASQQLLSGLVEFLACTSVAESENFSELEVPSIICYTPPQTVKSKDAREKHAAEDILAYINTLVTSNSPDGSFWLLRREHRKLMAAKPQQTNLDLTA